jgi:hypothetical protein
MDRDELGAQIVICHRAREELHQVAYLAGGEPGTHRGCEEEPRYGRGPSVDSVWVVVFEVVCLSIDRVLSGLCFCDHMFVFDDPF